MQTLDGMEKYIPREIIPMDYEILFEVGNMYYNAGAQKQYKEIAGEVEKEALKRLLKLTRKMFNPITIPTEY